MIGKREMQKITMTEKESIDISIHCLGVQAEQEVCEECLVYHEDGLACREAARVAIKALEEIQQYRAIGTVEEVEQNARDLKRQIEHSEHLAEVLKSTKSLLEKRGRLLSDYCKIGTVEECREAVEKQKPKKARFYSWSLYCPDCGQLVGNRRFKWENNFCRNCGRPIDWGEEE